MSKVETLVSQYKNELKYAGPFYISHEGFGAAPLGRGVTALAGALLGAAVGWAGAKLAKKAGKIIEKRKAGR